MARAVVILGAGASADFGVPTLATVFKDLRAQMYLVSNPAVRARLDEFFWTPRGHTLNTSDRSVTIEDMLTILRDWENEPDIPANAKPAGVTEFRRKLYVLIERAVFQGKSTKGEHLNPLIGIARSNFERTTWASFNWDCIFESSFWYSQPYNGPWSRNNPRLVVPISDWHQGSANHTFLKLHGAINWWMIDGHLTYLRFSSGGPLATRWDQYDQDPNCPAQPVILEPSFYKYEDEAYNLLAPQWTEFFARLLDAQAVIVIGYSLPPADAYARSKIVTAFQVNPAARWAVIDPASATLDRYRQLLGEQRVTLFQTGLSGFNNDILANLQAAFPDLGLHA